MALELAAEHLRRAQETLALITGAFSADDLLGVIFSRFCIGECSENARKTIELRTKPL
ncbi:MAG: hypothetical protein LBE32_04635 [Burkholderiales bacterium]|nr:hypothetical protein [Burkholderiales bacterium]